MRSSSLPALERRARNARRRSRRRTAVLSAGLAFGLIATVVATTAPPISAAEASGPAGGFALASFTMPSAPIAVVQTDGSDEISTQAKGALDEADAAIDAAAQVTADVTASGLDLGAIETTVDTKALGAAAERLRDGLDLPAPLVPGLTKKVTALVTSVEARVAEVRAGLDAAKALKAQQEAEAKAKAEAEAAAKAAEAEAARAQSSSAAAPSPVGVGGGASPAEAQAIASGMIGAYGWGAGQFSCLVSLWNRESGWNYQAYNSSSGAYGIPQALPGSKMGSAGADWQSNAATQISWGLGYIAGRSGSPCGAWSHSESVGWY